jgi:hypothetical protein
MPFRSCFPLLVAVLLAAGMTTYYFALLIPQVRAVQIKRDLGEGYYFGGDFYPIWLTTCALQLEHRNPYTDEMTRKIQTGLFGRDLSSMRPGDPPPHYRAFSYPLYADILAWPLARLSFREVQILLGFSFSLLTTATLLLWLRGLGVPLKSSSIAAFLLLYATSYPVLEAIFALQPTLLVAFCLAATSAALTRGRYHIAGTCLAVGAIKPQLTIPISVWLLFWALSAWKKRKGLPLSFAFVFLLLLATSERVLPGWFELWRAALLDYRQYTQPPLVELVLGRILGGATALLLLLLTVIRGWQARHSAPAQEDFVRTLALILAVTILLLPTGGAVYEHVLLIPALLWLYVHRHEAAKNSTPLRWTFTLLPAALLWQWVLACGVGIAASIRPAWRHSPQMLLLPLRLAAPLPFVVLILMGTMILRRGLNTSTQRVLP